MSELAFNLNGEPFDVPETATGWRVRRMKAKGAPEVVYGRNGQPLVVPIDADVDDVRSEVGTAGRYRFDAVDELNKPIDAVSAGYAYIHERSHAAAPGMASTSLPPPTGVPFEQVLIEALRTQAAIAMAVVERFPQMIDSSATLLRAADGAGLPARTPREDEAPEEEDDGDADEASAANAPASPSFDLLNTLVAQLVPLLINNMSGKKMPKLAAVLDWRKAQPKNDSSPEADVLATDDDATTQDVSDVLPPLDPKMMSHFIAIQSALTPNEATLARQLAAELSSAEQRAWLHELTALSVSDAVAKLRGILGSMAKAGGAS